MKKKVAIILLVILILCGISVVCICNDGSITAKDVGWCVSDDEGLLMFKDQNGEKLPAIEYKDSIYVPVRSFCGYMDKGVDWSESSGVYIYDLPENEYEGTLLGEQEGYEWVSIIELIAYPEKYNGKNIMARGIINIGFESDRLFLTKEDQVYFNNCNSIEWNPFELNFCEVGYLNEFYDEMRYLSGLYVEMEGTFVANEESASDQRPRGKLKDIKSIYVCEALCD